MRCLHAATPVLYHACCALQLLCATCCAVHVSTLECASICACREAFLKKQLDGRMANGRVPLQISTHYGWCALEAGWLLGALCGAAEVRPCPLPPTSVLTAAALLPRACHPLQDGWREGRPRVLRRWLREVPL